MAPNATPRLLVLDDLPPVLLRPSVRARHPRLSAGALVGIELILPARMSEGQARAIIRRQARWIRTTAARLGWEHGAASLPEALELRSEGLRVEILYLHEAGSYARMIVRSGPRLELAMDTDRPEEAAPLLCSFLRRRARAFLPRLVRELGRETGLGCPPVTVRSQRTRWGSCSARGRLSLNDRLLFLPPRLTRLVILHELCHLRHLNHGQEFRALLARHMPDHNAADGLLRHAGLHIPSLFRLPRA